MEAISSIGSSILNQLRTPDPISKTEEDLRANRVTELDFGHYDLTTEQCLPIFEALRVNTSLQKLCFRLVYSVEIKLLAEALKVNTSLQLLELYQCFVRADKIKILAEAIKVNTSLQHVILSYNYFGDEGAKVLAEALKVNTSLQHLNVENCLIGDDGAKSFAEALKLNTSLQHLSLNGNRIGDDGAKSFVEALKVNTALQQLDVGSGKLWDSEGVEIDALLKRNQAAAAQRKATEDQVQETRAKIKQRRSTAHRAKVGGWNEAARCPICFDHCENAVVLECSHWMCESCARLHVKFSHARTLQPPPRSAALDKKELDLHDPTSVPDGANSRDKGKAAAPAPPTTAAGTTSTAGLDCFMCPVCDQIVPCSSAADQLGLEQKAPVSRPPQAVLDCRGCGEAKVVWWCVDCAHAFCEQCFYNIHASAPKMQNHHVEDIIHGVRTNVAARQPERMCQHHQQPLTLCCVEDEVAVCSQCLLTGDHRRRVGEHWVPHECRPLAEMRESLQRDLAGEITRCRQQYERVDNAHRNVSDSIKGFHQARATAEQDVDAWVDGMIAQLEQLRAEKKQEVQTAWDVKFRPLQWQVGVLGSGRACIQETIAIAERVNEAGSSDALGLIDAASSVWLQLEEAGEVCNTVLKPLESGGFRFNSENTWSDDHMTKLRRAKVELTARAPNDRPTADQLGASSSAV